MHWPSINDKHILQKSPSRIAAVETKRPGADWSVRTISDGVSDGWFTLEGTFNQCHVQPSPPSLKGLSGRPVADIGRDDMAIVYAQRTRFGMPSTTPDPFDSPFNTVRSVPISLDRSRTPSYASTSQEFLSLRHLRRSDSELRSTAGLRSTSSNV